MLIDSGVNVATEMWKNHEKPMVSDNHLEMVVVFHVDFLAFTGENDSSQVVLEGMEHLSHRVSTPLGMNVDRSDRFRVVPSSCSRDIYQKPRK